MAAHYHGLSSYDKVITETVMFDLKYIFLRCNFLFTQFYVLF